MALADRTILEIVTAICPALATNGAYALYIDIATEETSSAFFGNYYNYAVALRAAHYYTIDVKRPDGDGGLITAKSEGKLSISYLHNMNRQSRSDLLMTQYGQRLHALIRSRGPIVSISSTEFDLDAGVFSEADEDFI